MSERPLSVRRDHSLLDAARQMSARNVGAVLVLDDTGALCGICTERDLLTKVVAQEKNASALTVADVMTPHPTVVNVGDDFETVYDTLMQINARHLPVTDGAKLVGIVSLRDVFKVRERILERHLDEEKDLVRSYQQLLDRPQEARIAHLLYEKEQLKRLAVTDELTGLYNFRYFQRRLDEEFNRAQRYGHELSVAICDLDDFKKINDTYGHPAGDEVLSGVGRMLGHSLDVVHVLVSLRLSDLVMRYGGEEFVVIFPETSLEDAHEAAERIRRAIAAYGFLPRKSEVPVHVTMSIGIASFPTHACRKEDLIQRADEALYQAKTAGKNLVVTYQNA
jgi:diguanylate cyclase (GGDEF)-like protein